MKLLYSNDASYGCGAYAVANILEWEEFITPERLEDSKDGNTVYQLSKWLEEDNQDLIIAPLYYNLGNVLPDDFEIGPADPEVFAPMFLTVASRRSGGHTHYVSVLCDQEIIYVFDNLKSTVLKMNWDTIKRYYKIIGIDGLSNRKGSWQVFDKKQFDL